ncbi:MAG: hypothetical protein ACOX8J_06535 [Candidatus Merdisoma sp.]
MRHAEDGRTGGVVLARKAPGMADSIGRKPGSEMKRSGIERRMAKCDKGHAEDGISRK